MSIRLALFTLMFGVLLIVPLITYAGESLEGNEICAAYGFKNPSCACGQCCQKKCSKAQLGIKGCDCTVHPPTGTVTGMCVTSTNCKGTGSTDQQGKQQGVGDAKGMMEALKGIMDALKGKGGGGGGGEQPPPTGQDGCTSFYQVTATSTDRCANYVPPISNSLLGDLSGGIDFGASNALFDVLEGGNALNVSEQLFGAINIPNTPQASETDQLQGTTKQTPTSAASPTPSPKSGLGGQAVSLQGGTQGNIEVTPTGATVIASARDEQANMEVAGFYGSTATSGEQPQGLVTRMCRSRPWSGSIVSYIIPPSFFDSLCAWRGYQVGQPPPASAPVVQQTPKTTPSTSSTPTTTTRVDTIPPEVEIWAVPDRVPLGARTTIFWNTKGVGSCTVTSPDGSFEEHALSGGGATVPLSGATTFSISCLTPSGVPAADFVTVNLSI